jgi:hypothetical protein
MKKARTQFVRRNLKKKNLFWILSFFCVFSLLGLYVSQVKGMTDDSFLITDCKSEITGLSQESREMESAFLKNKSLETAEELVRNSNFEEVGKVRYINVAGSIMVAK